jgi:hypothetical protein
MVGGRGVNLYGGQRFMRGIDGDDEAAAIRFDPQAETWSLYEPVVNRAHRRGCLTPLKRIQTMSVIRRRGTVTRTRQDRKTVQLWRGAIKRRRSLCPKTSHARFRAARRWLGAPPPSFTWAAIVAASIVLGPPGMNATARTPNVVSIPGSRPPGIIGAVNLSRPVAIKAVPSSPEAGTRRRSRPSD